MIIGGLQKLSLCDFPGQTAAVIFTRGCNFRCRFCHNGDLLHGRPDPLTDIPEPKLFQFLKKRERLLDGLVICGGEPTLQPDLIPFIKKVRNLGYTIKLDTNGSRPAVIEAVLEENLLDFIAMDIKAPWQTYAAICNTPVNLDDIRRSIELIVSNGIPHEFRTTWVKSLISETDLETIRKQIPVRANHKIQTFQPEHTLDTNLAG